MMRTLFAAILLCLAAAPLRGATVNNDDSCDIAVLPAATLLLPYFEVDIDDPSGDGESTIFTVTNVTNAPQAVQVTLWTDYAYPVIAFNIFLTGYDVQSINLFDVINRGRIAPDIGTGLDVSNVGELSSDIVYQLPLDNPLLDETTCRNLPVSIPPAYVARMRSAFTTGRLLAAPGSDACNTAGGVHDNAVGYATIDVVGACDLRLPNDPAYYSETIRWDNVLIGDYLQFNGREDFAQAAPLVHIRAIPEGGDASTRANLANEFPRTFYGRYQNAATPKLDGRQPLPSTFAARWINGGATGFETLFKIWREVPTSPTTACSAYPQLGGRTSLMELVRFDEEENFETLAPDIITLPIHNPPVLRATSLAHIANTAIFPDSPYAGEISGWVYMNLDDPFFNAVPSQNWVVSSLRAEDRFSVDVDATALGNGCAPPVPDSTAHSGHGTIGPVGGDDSCDIALLPAATLLLPYFEVDLKSPAGIGETTLFSVTNTSHVAQAVQVTLWTDYDHPVFAFNVFLTGYDVQTINLFDVLARGRIAPDDGTGLGVSNVGLLSGDDRDQIPFDNALLNEATCVDLPVQLPEALIARLQAAFTTGKVPANGIDPACDTAGGPHRNAVGYATIDVVGACDARMPTDPRYFQDFIRYDNVLIGDSLQVNGETDSAQGSPLVHIRAIPEGGRARTRGDVAVDFPRTFYGRFQSASAPKLDARQPLPSTFAARWLSAEHGFGTHFKIWREGRDVSGPCAPRRGAGLSMVEAVRFDEDENPETLAPNGDLWLPCTPYVDAPILPATSLTSVDDDRIFPPNSYAAAGGWMYLNLDYCDTDPFASQNWVVSSMRGGNRYSADVDSAALGNGCSAPAPRSEAMDFDGAPIGPAPNVKP